MVARRFIGSLIRFRSIADADNANISSSATHILFLIYNPVDNINRKAILPEKRDIQKDKVYLRKMQI
jgi:hypothetical protein